MKFDYIYGPVPSRRLGLSLGISPIPNKTCNYACIYCQLGRTNPMINSREMFFDVEDILNEFDHAISANIVFDVITIVGEGEPTLYLGLGKLIQGIKERIEKPVAVITNGALLYHKQVQKELMPADIVLPSLDAPDERRYKEVNRPHKSLKYEEVVKGLVAFSNEYSGELWIEIMLIKGMNDDAESMIGFKRILSQVKYDRLYINTPVRPPCEDFVEPVNQETMNHAMDVLKGLSIDFLASNGFASEIEDHIEAILSIIKRHPMNQYEITTFLKSRRCNDIDGILKSLENATDIKVKKFRGYDTYIFKV